jgi:lipopolysaccharide transport system ATP-binding protein
MSDIAIHVENLSKQYSIGRREPYYALRDVLAHSLTSPLRLFRRPAPKAENRPNAQNPTENGQIWALKDVSIEINKGDVVGVIGRNGAGKSTLLKILSRITEPTEGYVRIKGRVGSLLEVGTGFHPELTGRENIYLNGAILGMKRIEINGKFDEIVAFAEVEKFLDTPVKYYSSGMYVRLAFAVAAHLEPEILLVDEVLAVGDAFFQKKCLGKMGDVAMEGRTVLFVSHNLQSVEKLCPKSILLNGGRVVSVGYSGEVIQSYLSSYEDEFLTSSREVIDTGRSSTACDYRVLFHRVGISKVDSTATHLVNCGEPFKVSLLVQNRSCTRPFILGFLVKTIKGEEVFTSQQNDRMPLICVDPGAFVEASCTVSPNLLRPGLYKLDLGIIDESGRPIDYVTDAIGFEVLPSNSSLSFLDRRPGLIILPLDWEIQINRQCSNG